MVETVSGLGDHLGYWMRLVSNHVSSAFARKLADNGVTVAEWVAMRALYDMEPASPSRLAGEMKMTKGAITKLMDRLAAKAFVGRAPSKTDTRAQILTLTKKGKALVPVLAKLADENESDFFRDLGPDQRNALIKILQEIVEQRGLTAVPID